MVNPEPTFKPKCPNCSNFMVKAGFHTQKKKGRLQRFKCQNCGTIRLESNLLGEKIGL